MDVYVKTKIWEIILEEIMETSYVREHRCARWGWWGWVKMRGDTTGPLWLLGIPMWRLLCLLYLSFKHSNRELFWSSFPSKKRWSLETSRGPESHTVRWPSQVTLALMSVHHITWSQEMIHILRSPQGRQKRPKAITEPYYQFLDLERGGDCHAAWG